jgi:hypothetical protein
VLEIRRRPIVLAALLVFAAATVALPAPSQDKPETRRAETLAPGVEHVEIRRGDFTPDREADRWIIHVLSLDPRLVRLVSALAMDEIAGAEPTSSIAARYGALAAVNGGYFRTTGVARGEPTGIYVTGGKVLSEPSRPRVEMAISNADGVARLAIAQVDFEASVVIGPDKYTVSGINRPREEDELIVYTPEFHRTTLTPPGGLEAAVQNGRVAAVVDGAGSSAIPSDGFVVSAGGRARAWALPRLRTGVRLDLEQRLAASPPLPFSAETIIGGGPYLVRAGRPFGPEEADAEGFSRSEFTAKRHPRTAAGTRLTRPWWSGRGRETMRPSTSL